MDDEQVWICRWAQTTLIGLRVVGYCQEIRALQDALTIRRVILWTNFRSLPSVRKHKWSPRRHQAFDALSRYPQTSAGSRGTIPSAGLDWSGT